MLCHVGGDTSLATCLAITDIILSFFWLLIANVAKLWSAYISEQGPGRSLGPVLTDEEKKKAHRNRWAESIFI